ncbi:MAG: Serine dehydratase subunit alpha family protein [Oscillospiraceae bacterium]|jgi:L-cysteine desulfidase
MLQSGEDKLIRAVTLSNLIAIYIKSKFGRLSALCGATVAGTGAACGVTYLLGGGLKEISYAIQNMVGNVTGMLCDGAKADCALKISTCTSAAMQAAFLAMKGLRIQNTDGIVEEDVEKTIENFATLGNKGSVTIDSLILEMMIRKNKKSQHESLSH